VVDQIRALSIFAATYALISTRRTPFIRLDRPAAALAGAVLMIAAGVLTPDQAYRAIDWDTIALLLGMFILTGSLRLAGFFELAQRSREISRCSGPSPM
jgi:Na+/H+ antiporter NhaD/arsenite permease-like protein